MEDSGTRLFYDHPVSPEEVRELLGSICQALREKGYNPVDQLVGYLLSGDPAYITSHNGARSMMGRLERHQVLEELVRYYMA